MPDDACAPGMTTSRRLLTTTIHLILASGFATTTVTAQEAEPRQLPKVRVEATEFSDYKPESVQSPKYTAPLRDTPQAITVIPRPVIEDQALLSLRDILSTVPGITFGAGEGGGGYGDSINLRGFTGSNDITIDGVRDSAQYTRSDPFNLEQVEVVNGANSVYSGAGSVGGSVNLVSKTAQEGDSTLINGGLGTDRYGRFTLDTNQQLTDSLAFRLNAMYHENQIAGRDFEQAERWGIAPSIMFGLGSDTTFSLSLLHQSDDNTPQYGVPFYNGAPLPGVDSSNYYGYHNIDRQQIDVDSLTAVLTHRFNESLSVRNLSRIQQVGQVSIVDAVQGTWCLPGNLTPTGAACTSGTGASQIVVPEGFYLPSGPRGLVRDTVNRLFYNQTDLTSVFRTGAVEHTLVAGLAFTHETFELDTSNLFRNEDGSNPFVAPNHLPFMDLFDPDSRYVGPLNRTLTGRTDGEQDNVALYAFDTLKFSARWQLNAGLRFERNEGSSTAYIVSAIAPTIGEVTGANAPADNADTLLSYRAGLVFKPVEAGSIYLAYGNSKTPSKASVNGSCTATSTTGTANCNVDPESAVSYELGTKWDFKDGRLSLTGSVFRNERRNYRVADPDPANLSGEQSLDGRARVSGLLLGVAGNVLDSWAVYANYSYLQSEVLQGASQYVSDLGQDYTKGDDLLNVPEHALSLWTTYDFPFGLQIGYGATYQGKIFVAQHSATNIDGPLARADDYLVHRLMANYRVTRALNVQLNVNNLLDEEYYIRIRNNGWATPGEGRVTVLGATYSF